MCEQGKMSINLSCPCCGETPGDHNELDCSFQYIGGRWINPEDRTSQFSRYFDSGCMNDMRFGAYDD